METCGRIDFDRSGLSVEVGEMRIRVVEDEPKIAAFLRKGLTENGFVVDVSRQGDAPPASATIHAMISGLPVRSPRTVVASAPAKNPRDLRLFRA